MIYISDNNSHLGISINGPPNEWFVLGNMMKMDDDWGYPISGNLHLDVSYRISSGFIMI